LAKRRKLRAKAKAKGLADDVRYEILGMLCLASAVLIYLSLYSDKVGVVGVYVSRFLRLVIGRSAPIAPLILAGLGGVMLARRSAMRYSHRVLGLVLIIGTVAAYLHRGYALDSSLAVGLSGQGGGLLGAGIHLLLMRAFGSVGYLVVTLTAGAIAFMLVTNVSLIQVAARLRRGLGVMAGWIWDGLVESILEEEEAEPARYLGDTVGEEWPRSPGLAVPLAGEAREGRDSMEHSPLAGEAPEFATERGDGRPGGGKVLPLRSTGKKKRQEEDDEVQINKGGAVVDYLLPSTSLLSSPAARHGRPGRSNVRLEDKGRVLEGALASFGVEGRVVNTVPGPTVTRYEIQPAAGVKISRISSLANDLALHLAVPDVRIVAPVPGKSVVGIEVPNREVSPVYLRQVLESRDFRNAQSKLLLALGKDITGAPLVASLENLLHLLVGGQTGSGKSICLRCIIASILFKARPDEVRLVLIDPKVVELNIYNGIPHLLLPVVTDPKRAASCLRWAVREMEKRYETFAAAGVRDIERYNQAAESRGEERMPFLVIIIDELADLMSVARVDVEDAIQRLAQMARASGIHLVVATQRPSVDVITGVIKANIPSRLAFAVASQVDSRTILDQGGAEKLVGRGDMLFSPLGSSDPLRAQGAYLSDEDLDNLLENIRSQAEPDYADDLLAAGEDGEDNPEQHEDDKFPEAVLVVLETGQASVSMLQRRLRVGYTRAGRLIDMMERQGVVGPHQGPKPRDLLIGWEEYKRMFPERGSVD